MIDSVVVSFLVNLASSSFYELLRTNRNSSKQPTQISKQQNIEISTKIQEYTITNIAKKYSNLLSDTEIIKFLQTIDAEMAMQVIHATKWGPNKQENIDLAKSNFHKLFGYHYFKPDKEIISNKLFILFTLVAEHVSKHHRIQVKAPELQSSYYRQTNDRITGYLRSLHGLSKGDEPVHSFDQMAQFQAEHAEAIIGIHGLITPQSTSGVTKQPIDCIFVNPDLSYSDKRQNTTRFKGIPPWGHRVVILGTPGAGKSTLLNKFAYDTSIEFLTNNSRVIPFHVIIKDLFGDPTEKTKTLSDYLTEQIKLRYQVSAEIPQNYVNFLIASGQCRLLLDGLDELVNTADRTQITERIEAFSRANPSVSIIVTSREVGYEDAPLDSSLFETYRLAPFSSGQTKEYATKWFTQISPTADKDQLSSKITTFMRESEASQDLRQNPLMLSLICSLYNEEGYIPRNRPEVYEKCANLLFEKWDRHRGIVVPLQFEFHVSSAMKHLAYWMYSSQERQSGVTEEQLVNETQQYLLARVIENHDQALQAAEAFVNFCQGRAWVFTDVGTKPTGQKIFSFTHRTFLEFFAASHLVRAYPSVVDLYEHLSPRIRSSSWEVVSDLSVQIICRQQEEASNRIVDLFSEDFSAQDFNCRVSMIGFILTLLRGTVPSPGHLRRLLRILFEFAVDLSKQDELDRHQPYEKLHEHMWLGIADLAIENTSTLQNELEDLMLSYLSKGKYAEFAVINEIVTMALASRSYEVGDSPSYRQLVNWQMEFVDSHLKMLLGKWKKCKSLAILLLHQGKIEPVEFLKRFGLVSLYEQDRSHLYHVVTNFRIFMALQFFKYDRFVRFTDQQMQIFFDYFYGLLLKSKKRELLFCTSWIRAKVDMSKFQRICNTSERRTAALFLLYPAFDFSREATEGSVENMRQSDFTGISRGVSTKDAKLIVNSLQTFDLKHEDLQLTLNFLMSNRT